MEMRNLCKSENEILEQVDESDAEMQFKLIAYRADVLQDPLDQIDLGVLYACGEGVDRDIGKGLQYINLGLSKLGDDMPWYYLFSAGQVLLETGIERNERNWIEHGVLLTKKLLSAENIGYSEKNIGSDAVDKMKQMLIDGMLKL